MASRNPVGHNRSDTGTAVRLQAVTPSDTVDLNTEARMIYVGTGGNVAVMDNNTETWVNGKTGAY